MRCENFYWSRVVQKPNEVKELSSRWTREILRRCTPRELLVMVAAYGPLAIAQRMGYSDIQAFVEENTRKKQ